jgi:hypothetical protein
MSFLGRLLSINAAAEFGAAKTNTGDEDERDIMTGTSDEESESEGAAMSK